MDKLINSKIPIMVKPFLKWAGGKSQLLPLLTLALPKELYLGKLTYIEPFVGSGALLFWILNHIPQVSNIIINDANPDLINTYKVIKDNVNELIKILESWEKEYLNLEIPLRKKYYMEKRLLYNKKVSDAVTHAALFIFLNRTCFNGLYRVNRKGEFNVPMGRYKNPKICDRENLIAVSKKLKKVLILNKDFEEVIDYVRGKGFFYFDPPYKPITKTSSFTAYHYEEFSDKDQVRLKNFCAKLDKIGHLWMLSNSDLKEGNKNNDFFDRLYEDYYILRVSAKRSINSKPDKRGRIKELLITNYSHNLNFKMKIA